MESIFIALAAASLLVTGMSSAKLAALPLGCGGAQHYETTTPLAPFGRIEQGWQIYEAQVARTIGTRCASDTKAFAATLATWQARHRLPATGAVDPTTLGAMKHDWQHARPFIAAFKTGVCPDAATDERLGRHRAEGRVARQTLEARSPGAGRSSADGGGGARGRPAHRGRSADADDRVGVSLARLRRRQVRERRELQRHCEGPLLGASHGNGRRPLCRRRARTVAGFDGRRQPAPSIPDARLSLAGEERGALRLCELCVRAVALGVGRRAGPSNDGGALRSSALRALP